MSSFEGLLEAQDGHTLMFAPISVLTTNPLLHGTLPYDPERGFAPISLAVEDLLCVAAAPSLGVNSLSELEQPTPRRVVTPPSAAIPHRDRCDAEPRIW